MGVNMDTETMGINIHSEAWDYSVGMVCTVTVDMVTTEAFTVDIILHMVISMEDMVVTLKATRSLSHTCNLKSMGNLQLIANLQLMANLQLTANLQHIANLKHMANPKRIHLKHLSISSNLLMHVS